MTVAQCTESPQRSRSSARQPLPNSEHNALNETATMSSHGLQQPRPVASAPSSRETSTNFHDETLPDRYRDAETQTSDAHTSNHSESNTFAQSDTGKLPGAKGRKTPYRIQFGEFAEQLRQQQYFENRKNLLRRRKKVLHKTITLSARLHRVSSWVGDGLVEISAQSDVAGFARVHQHFQNLIDLSYSQWDRELHALDPLGRSSAMDSEAAGGSGVLSKLSSSAQADLFKLLSYLRSNPRFLVERLRILAPAQIVALWNPPRPQGPRNAAESQYGSFTRVPLRSWDQRIQSFSKSLEDYSSSLERSNPLSLLLFNVYGTDRSSTHAENELRLSTWSKVCAELMLTSERTYSSLILQLLDCFASLYDWRARDSVELFLMDTLQRGAFLLDQSPDYKHSRRFVGYDPLKTPEAQTFFDTAVRELFNIFMKYDGGFPTGALQFASAVLDRLPEQQRSEFRGTFLSTWFIEHFLQIAIHYPENEDMLLKFHISKDARKKILHQLTFAIRDRVHDVFELRPMRPVDPDFRDSVMRMSGWMDSVESINPYEMADGALSSPEDRTEASSITLSVSEIVQMLEAISPQTIHSIAFLDQLLETPAALTATHGHYAIQRFDQLKNDLISLQEPGSSVVDVHPCQEQWLQIDIDMLGRPMLPSYQIQNADSFQKMETSGLDSAQKGALRLYRDQVADLAVPNGATYRSDLLRSSSLEVLFYDMMIYSSAKHDPIGSNYWNEALETLQDKYPLSSLIQDDSAVLQKMLKISKELQTDCRDCCLRLEIQLSAMEEICLKIRSAINGAMERFDSLRLKLWYFSDVVLSKQYSDAKGIAIALNNMAISSIRKNSVSSNSSFLNGRPMSARSVASSTFEQPFEDTMNMIKAPASQGGPMKLADRQIELTNNWLAQTHIDPFCKGEERIHRFCMEVYETSRNLVGETLQESPVLWSSELFTREQGLYNIHSYAVTSAPASTRASSIMSNISMTYRPSHPPQRTAAESLMRMTLLEDRRSNSSRSIRREYPHAELGSSIGSLSRAHSATTAESISSVFTPQTSNSRSLTSPSVYSTRSIFNESSLSRFTDNSREKARFLEKVRQTLTCLLLSDLGCPVWTMGSETDAMLKASRDTATVNERLKQRMVADCLVDRTRTSGNLRNKRDGRLRSKSVSLEINTNGLPRSLDMNEYRERQKEQAGITDSPTDQHLASLSEVLTKLSQQVDPMEKLAAIEEFYNLSLTTHQPIECCANIVAEFENSTPSNARRRSLDERGVRQQPRPHSEYNSIKYSKEQSHRSLSEHQIRQHLKADLTRLCPRTLFRDLQYISAFVPTEHVDNTSQGKALLQLGLAALAYKDEVCRSMVDVADAMNDKIQMKQASQPQEMQQIARLWMFAAREGNAVAQRQLGWLYLSQPKLLQVMILPLFMPSQVFKYDMVWFRYDNDQTDPQALCLALHWLQQASNNGDKQAKQILEERRGGNSIR